MAMLEIRTAQDAIDHIESLYPPDSQYSDTAAIGREFMDCIVGSSSNITYDNWRQLGAEALCSLAKALIDYHLNEY